ncbi:hypothetical protein P9112_000701 [Eukaryota sp. TZLM1-RC]
MFSTTKVKDLHINYRFYGADNDPLCIIIHGITSCSSTMIPIAEHLSSQGLRVLIFDLIGHGASTATSTPITTSYFLSFFSSFLTSLNLDTTPFHLIGHSMGGCLAVCVATSSTHNILSLFLMAPFIKPDNEPFSAKLIRLPLINKALIKLIGERKLIQHLAETNSDPEIVQILRKSLSELFSSRPEYLSVTFTNYFRNILSLDYSPLYSQCEDLNIPVGYLWGDNDLVIPASSKDLALECLGGGAEVFILSGNGHELQIECSEVVGSKVIEFIRGI